MPAVQIQVSPPRPVRPDTTLLALGFRPFFLAAAFAATGLLSVWVIAYAGGVNVVTYYDPINWHGHEMIFGYTAAVIAGFLLTAVRNWTNMPTVHATPLLLLALLWLAGRVVGFLPHVLPGWLIAAVDLAFLPALAFGLAAPLVRSRQVHNLVFLPLLAALAVANALVHFEVLGITAGTARPAMFGAVDLIVLIITIIGGRVIPFFTERALASRPRRWVAVERAAIGSTLAVAAVDLLDAAPWLVGALAVVAAASHAVRLWGWYDRRIWQVPLVWVLHLGYAWLPLGFALKAAAAAGLMMPLVALHAFTAGAIGVLTLGMMSRVALGHTGRPLRAATPVAIAFALLNTAAVIRVLLASVLPDWYVEIIGVAGALWIAAFFLFAAVYTPILIHPRADGRPG